MNKANQNKAMPFYQATSEDQVLVRSLGENAILGRLLSLSTERLCFSSDSHLPPGRRLELEVLLDETDPVPILLTGISVWSCGRREGPILVNLDIRSSQASHQELLFGRLSGSKLREL